MLEGLFAKTPLARPRGALRSEAIELRDMPAVAASQQTDSLASQEVCPITLEPISSYQVKDVFTTLDGKNYHRPSLRAWLSLNDRMPHNNMAAPQEIDRLWPSTKSRTAAMAVTKFAPAGLSLAAVAAFGIGGHAAHKIHGGEQWHIEGLAHLACQDRLLVPGYDVSQYNKLFAVCVQATVQSVKATYAESDRRNLLAAAVVCSLGAACLLGSAALCLYGRRLNRQFRVLTDEERDLIGQA